MKVLKLLCLLLLTTVWSCDSNKGNSATEQLKNLENLSAANDSTPTFGNVDNSNVIASNGEDDIVIPPADADANTQVNTPGEGQREATYLDYYNEARRRKEAGKIQECFDFLSQSIRMQPNFYEGYSERGNLLLELNQLSKAAEDLKKATEIDPNKFNAHYQLGLVYAQLGQNKSAANAYSKAIEIQPNNRVAVINRGVAYNASKQYQKAKKDFTKVINQCEDALNNDFDNCLLAYRNRAIVYQALKQYGNAAADYTKILDRDSSNVQARFDRGNAYYLYGKTFEDKKDDAFKPLYRKSIADLTIAAQQQPNNAEIYYNRSVAYSHLGDKESAVKDVKKAQALGKTIKKVYLDWLEIE